MKKFKILLLMIAFMFMMAPVYADGNVAGCSSTLSNNGLEIDGKIADTVHIIIFVIQIIVPVILVIFGMIDLIKAVIAGKEDEIKKHQTTFIKRLLAAAIVFFVFVIVKLVISFAAGNDEKPGILNCMECFINGTGSEACKTSK